MNNTVKIQKKSTLMVAHRGVSGLETENTSAAFIAAGNRSYYGIETDVHPTKDGKFVCIHDDNTKRVSGVSLDVEKSTYSEILKVKLLDRENGKGERADLVVPTLQDYISICKAYGKHSVLELKSPYTISQLEQIVKIISDIGHLSNTTFISFYPENMFNMRNILPEQSCQFLIDRIDGEVLNGILKARVDIDVYYTALNEKTVKLLKDNGIKINCWTVDDVKIAEKLVALGVDYITSNILE